MLFGSVMVLHFAELPILAVSVSILLIAIFFLIYFKIHKIKNLEFFSAIVIGFCLTATVASYQQSQSLDPSFEGKDLLISGSVDSLVRVT